MTDYETLKSRVDTDDGTYWWALTEIERLREALRLSYQDCLDAVEKVKRDPFTELGMFKTSKYGTITAKDWMVAMAEDIEREIKARAALGEDKE